MAYLCNRIALKLARTQLNYTAVRYAGEKLMNDPIEHATGIEKRELLAREAGDVNPYDLRVFKRGPGTKEEPIEIPSAFDSRLVGCICEDDQTHVLYMWLIKGTPKRCECGYWFKILEIQPF